MNNEGLSSRITRVEFRFWFLTFLFVSLYHSFISRKPSWSYLKFLEKRFVILTHEMQFVFNVCHQISLHIRKQYQLQVKNRSSQQME